MTSNVFICRVYADGRLCIPAPVIRRYRELTGDFRKSLFIGPYKNIENSWMHVMWRAGTGSFKEYDLSIRGRVLFGHYKPGKTYETTVSKKGIFIQIGKASGPNRGDGTPIELRSKKAKKKKATKKLRPDRIATLEAEFEELVRERLVKMLQTELTGVTLAQLAAVMPDLTIGELMNRQ